MEKRLSQPLTAIQVRRRDTIDGRAHNPSLQGWRTLAYCPSSDAAAEEARQRARFGAHEPTLQFRQREQNPPHGHIPPQSVALGFSLDLTTQFRDARTTWDFEIRGWRMLCEPGAMEQEPGRAALYLVRVADLENSERESNARRKSRELSRDRASMQTLWIGHREAGVIGRARWIDLDGAERDRWIAVAYDGRELQAHPEDTHAAPFDQTFATQGDARQALSDYFRANQPPETNGKRRNPSHAEGRRTYEQWHERQAAEVIEVDDLPDLIGVYVGRATRIGYSSDKWNKRGKMVDYEHDFTEGRHTAPECWADTAELADARALVIVGGDMRITEDGID